MDYRKSPLKWAGSKRTVLPELLPLFAKHLAENPDCKFIEPFTGSGVVAMNVNHDYKIINEINPDLTNFYDCCINNPDELILETAKLFTKNNCNITSFLRIRDEFNSCNKTTIYSAALFLYLNKHGFNGLCRYNKKGQFNVPPHSVCKNNGPVPSVPVDEIKDMHYGLVNSNIYNLNFSLVMKMAVPGDLIYCDPPYFAFEDNASFTSYTKDGFSLCNQIELAYEAKRQSELGVTVIVSNAATPTCVQLYKELGATIKNIEVIRSVGAEVRGTAKEIIAIF